MVLIAPYYPSILVKYTDFFKDIKKTDDINRELNTLIIMDKMSLCNLKKIKLPPKITFTTAKTELQSSILILNLRGFVVYRSSTNNDFSSKYLANFTHSIS